MMLGPPGGRRLDPSVAASFEARPCPRSYRPTATPFISRVVDYYVKAQQLGGVILWHLGKDGSGANQPLLQAARSCR